MTTDELSKYVKSPEAEWVTLPKPFAEALLDKLRTMEARIAELEAAKAHHIAMRQQTQEERNLISALYKGQEDIILNLQEDYKEAERQHEVAAKALNSLKTKLQAAEDLANAAHMVFHGDADVYYLETKLLKFRAAGRGSE
jgi:hypothetical protein